MLMSMVIDDDDDVNDDDDDDDDDEVGLGAKSKINQGTGSGDERRSDCSSSQFNKTPFLNLQLSVFTIFMTMMVTVVMMVMMLIVMMMMIKRRIVMMMGMIKLVKKFIKIFPSSAGCLLLCSSLVATLL